MSEIYFARKESDTQVRNLETCQSFICDSKEQLPTQDQKKLPFCKQLSQNLKSLCNCIGQGSIFGNYLQKLHNQNLKKRFQIPDQDENSLGKKTLVIDLDETLVRSTHTNNNSDFSLSLKINNQQTTIYVNKRPYAEEFILMMSEIYEIIVFTASLQEYALPTIEAIDKYNKIKYKLFRENCTFWNGILVKDLTTLNRNIKDVILIDNSPFSAKFQPENCILIKSFYGDPLDKELENYIPFLLFLQHMNDIRPINQYEQRFYLKKQFEVTNKNTRETQKIDPNKYFEEWQTKKLKTQLRHDIDCYAETPMTQETEILLMKEPPSSSKFSLPEQATMNKQFQQNFLNIQQSNNQTDQNIVVEIQEDEICNEFPEPSPRDINIYKNLRITTLRSEVSGLNVNSPLSIQQLAIKKYYEQEY